MQATEFYLQNEGPFAHFGYLCRNIQQFFKTGQAPYPPERTLLTTGVIDAAMISRHEGHRRVETPYLDIDLSVLTTRCRSDHRGTRPSGACIDPQSPDIL